MLKTTLNLDALEAREVPAAIGWVKGGPQPEPPTVVVKVGILLPSLSVSVTNPVVAKAGILLPSLNQVQPDIHLQNSPINGILFPAFVGR